jgi:hypothetical protein
MNIICTDNFDRDEVADVVIAENVSYVYGQELVDFLNAKHGGRDSSYFFKMVSNEYKLKRGLDASV